MVSPIRFRKSDPNLKDGFNRGEGPYYLRGSYKRIHPFFSKYSESRDAKIKSSGFDIDKIGLPRKSKGFKVTSNILHNSDGNIRRY